MQRPASAGRRDARYTVIHTLRKALLISPTRVCPWRCTFINAPAVAASFHRWSWRARADDADRLRSCRPRRVAAGTGLADAKDVEHLRLAGVAPEADSAVASGLADANLSDLSEHR